MHVDGFMSSHIMGWRKTLSIIKCFLVVVMVPDVD